MIFSVFGLKTSNKENKMKLYFSVITTLVLATTAQACPPTSATVRNTQGQTTHSITPTAPGSTTSRITTPDGRTQAYVDHSTGRIVTPDGRTQAYVRGK